jgi:hypothetical protein
MIHAILHYNISKWRTITSLHRCMSGIVSSAPSTPRARVPLSRAQSMAGAKQPESIVAALLANPWVKHAALTILYG